MTFYKVKKFSQEEMAAFFNCKPEEYIANIILIFHNRTQEWEMSAEIESPEEATHE